MASCWDVFHTQRGEDKVKFWPSTLDSGAARQVSQRTCKGCCDLHAVVALDVQYVSRMEASLLNQLQAGPQDMVCVSNKSICTGHYEKLWVKISTCMSIYIHFVITPFQIAWRVEKNKSCTHKSTNQPLFFLSSFSSRLSSALQAARPLKAFSIRPLHHPPRTVYTIWAYTSCGTDTMRATEYRYYRNISRRRAWLVAKCDSLSLSRAPGNNRTSALLTSNV